MAVFFNWRRAKIERIEFVQYIQSSGTQYIDTGFAPDYKSGYLLDFQLTTIATDDLTIMGSLDPNICFLGGNSQFEFAYKESTGASGSFGPNDTNRHIWGLNYMQSGTCDLDSQSVALDAFTGANTKTAYIFAAHYTNPSVYGLIAAKIYSAKITDGNEIVRDYRPAKDPDGVACLYEQISETYVYNAGTGSFIAGPEI